MTAGWVLAADQSKTRIPISRYAEAYRGGLRVLGGYGAGGSADKWMPAREIDAWLSTGDDCGFAGLFEIYGHEPVTNPAAGDDHARAARAWFRGVGYPDHAAIHAAMDRDVTMGQAAAELTDYYRRWKAADTVPAVAYVEADAGALLYAEQVTAGTFVPAAWGWDPRKILFTPGNAEPHMVWTQEDNGVDRWGGNLDLGHIRTTAPIWWADGRHADIGVDMATLDDQDKLWLRTVLVEAILGAKVFVRPAAEQTDTGLSLAWAARGAYFRSGYVANTGVPAITATLGQIIELEHAEAAQLDDLSEQIAAQVTAGGGGLTAEQVETVKAAVVDVLSRSRVVVVPEPAAPPAAG